MQVAETILAQLGGRRFRLMTGAKNFIGSPDSLSFRVPGAIKIDGRQVRGVRVVLTPADVYNVEFIGRLNGMPCVLRTVEGVYADMLAGVFTAGTGLVTRL